MGEWEERWVKLGVRPPYFPILQARMFPPEATALPCALRERLAKPQEGMQRPLSIFQER